MVRFVRRNEDLKKFIFKDEISSTKIINNKIFLLYYKLKFLKIMLRFLSIFVSPRRYQVGLYSLPYPQLLILLIINIKGKKYQKMT